MKAVFKINLLLFFFNHYEILLWKKCSFAKKHLETNLQCTTFENTPYTVIESATKVISHHFIGNMMHFVINE